jgi:integrase
LRDLAPAEIRAIIGSLTDHWQPILLTAIFTGLRASELRGLPWTAVDLKRGEIQVRQRADAYGRIGSPKSAAGSRTVPLPPLVTNTLREWKLTQPQAELVFAAPRGQALAMSTLVRRGWQQAQLTAGITAADGAPKYPGFHALRHFYASWCINRRVDGGLELPLKVVQDRLGHASDQDDGRHLRASVPAPGRRRRASCRRAGVHAIRIDPTEVSITECPARRRRRWGRAAP